MTQGIANSVREEMVSSAGGVQVFIRSWKPALPARAAVAIVHGVKSHGGYYQRAAEELAAAGIAVYALDLRGRGRSGGPRLYVEDVGEYTADVRTLVALAKSREPGLPVYLLGHSAGGVVACTYALDHQAEIDGLICESFAFRVAAPGFVLTVVKWLSRIAPRLPVLRLRTADFSRDPAVVRAMVDDPLGVHREAQPASTVAALVRATERMEREFPRITLPVLILHGTADRVTMPAGSRQFHEAAGSADKTLKLYEAHAHDLLNDLGRERVMADIVAWLDARIAGS